MLLVLSVLWLLRILVLYDDPNIWVIASYPDIDATCQGHASWFEIVHQHSDDYVAKRAYKLYGELIDSKVNRFSFFCLFYVSPICIRC
jgi:hypothetical protein